MSAGNLGEKRYNLFLSLIIIMLAMIFVIAYDMIQYSEPTNSVENENKITGNVAVSEFSLNVIEISESALFNLKNISIVLISFITMYVISLKGKKQ